MKTYVICHMCTTIDGKILGERWGKLPGGIDSGKLFENTANTFGIHAWAVGTTTMREFSHRDFALPAATQEVERVDYVAESKAKRFGIGTDAKGVLRFKRGDVNGDHVVVLISERVSNDYLAHLRAAGVSYLFCGSEQVEPKIALRKLGKVLGIRKLLLEGGGTLNGAWLKARLIDEISQVIVPIVDGAVGVVGFFDIPGPASRKAVASLRLIKQQKLAGGIQWNRYRVAGKP
jgi:2,5-diamino-6-(ribosylamino)-4(3H)-pyrimidinone 5'-phosphate reductase